MRKFSLCAICCLFAMGTAFAHYQVAFNAIGDLCLETVSGEEDYVLTPPISIDLKPSDAYLTNGVYSLRCRILYRDGDIEFPVGDEAVQEMRNNSRKLNRCLLEFVASTYEGMDYDTFLTRYFCHDFGTQLNDDFRALVAESLDALAQDERPSIGVERVLIEAEDDLRGDLWFLRKKLRRDGQDL